jgi:predicted peptidase
MTRLARAAMWIGVLMAAAIGSAGAGGGPPEGFIYQSIEVGGRVYPYAVYRPRGLGTARPARGLVFLHGRGECGEDGSKQLAVGLGPRLLWEPERWPFVVIFPQKPDGESEWEDHALAVLAMLDRAIVEHGVDPGRVAITGLSQGGHGTIRIAARHPDRFRAAAPVCGYIERWWLDGRRVERSLPGPESSARLVEAFRSTPIWLLHGGRDDVVPPIESETLHNILVGGGVDAKLTIFPEDGHNAWDSAYGWSGLWEWLVQMTE